MYLTTFVTTTPKKSGLPLSIGAFKGNGSSIDQAIQGDKEASYTSFDYYGHEAYIASSPFVFSPMLFYELGLGFGRFGVDTEFFQN